MEERGDEEMKERKGEIWECETFYSLTGCVQNAGDCCIILVLTLSGPTGLKSLSSAICATLNKPQQN